MKPRVPTFDDVDNGSVLISGASIAGPALALWLERYGFEVTVVEKAPGIRPGGQAVDFKGATHRTVLSRMGILEDVHRLRTHSGDGAIVDAQGRRLATMPQEFSGGEVEIARGDLARLLWERTAERCEYVFDDSIIGLRETADGVEVDFARSPSRTFDLVVGADGIHSNVRRLAFGPESEHVRHLGYYYALAQMEVGDRDELYSEPGRSAATGGPKAPAFFVFASEPLTYDRDDTVVQRRLVQEAYAGGGWRIPELMEQLPTASEFYLDAICRATVERYWSGRVVLVGDAAYGNTLGGFGTGMAIVGAYVLAGELAAAGGDHRVAFGRYDESLRRYARSGQTFNAGRLMAPKTRLGIRGRNALFSVSGLFVPFMKLMDRFATDIELVDYEGDRVS